MFHGPDEPVYTISVAARLLGVSPQLLRQIESEGLIFPARTTSNIRLYSENDLKSLARIIYLLRDCGINWQGVKVIIAMEQGRSPGSDAGSQRQRKTGLTGEQEPGSEEDREPVEDTDLVRKDN